MSLQQNYTLSWDISYHKSAECLLVSFIALWLWENQDGQIIAGESCLKNPSLHIAVESAVTHERPTLANRSYEEPISIFLFHQSPVQPYNNKPPNDAQNEMYSGLTRSRTEEAKVDMGLYIEMTSESSTSPEKLNVLCLFTNERREIIFSSPIFVSNLHRAISIPLKWAGFMSD